MPVKRQHVVRCFDLNNRLSCDKSRYKSSETPLGRNKKPMTSYKLKYRRSWSRSVRKNCKKNKPGYFNNSWTHDKLHLLNLLEVGR